MPWAAAGVPRRVGDGRTTGLDVGQDDVEQGGVASVGVSQVGAGQIGRSGVGTGCGGRLAVAGVPAVSVTASGATSTVRLLSRAVAVADRRSRAFGPAWFIEEDWRNLRLCRGQGVRAIA